jgi:hypothetical protein
MGTNKERIEHLEIALGEVQDVDYIEWRSIWLIGIVIWRKPSIVSLMYYLLTRNLQTTVINIVKATMEGDKLYPPKQRSLRFLDFQEMTRQNGSIV